MPVVLACCLLFGSVEPVDGGVVESPDASLTRKEALAACLKSCAAQVNEPAVEKKGPELLECLGRCERENPAPAPHR